MIKGKNIEYIRADLEHLPVKSTCVDIFLMHYVHEHLKNPSIVFKEIGRVLKPIGTFISWLPNAFTLSSLVVQILPTSVKKFLKKFIEEKEDVDAFPTYYRVNTCSKLDRMLQRENFQRMYLEMANDKGYLSKWKWGFYMHMLGIKICNTKYFNRFKSQIFVVYTKNVKKCPDHHILRHRPLDEGRTHKKRDTFE